MTTPLDRAEAKVNYYEEKLIEFPDIRSDEHKEYIQLLKEARETYNLLLRNQPAQGN
jgi:hypothetical protein